MNSWWRKLFASPRTQPIKNHKSNRARLRLEALEDRLTPATVTLEATVASALEASSTPGTFTFTRDDTVGDLTVNFSIAGSATETDDFDAIGVSVVIPDGEDTATVDITPVDDRLVEGNETVTLTITAGAYTIGAQDSDTVTITDNDSAVLAIAPTATVTEGGGAQSVGVTLTITANGTVGTAGLATALTADVSDAGGGSAVSGTDYSVLATQTVTFAAGDYATLTDTQNITVTPTDDRLVEGNEFLNLALTNLNATLDGQASLGNAANVTTITDDDSASLAIAPTASVTEGGGAQSVGVTLTITANGTVGTAGLATALTADVSDAGGGSADSGDDYTAFGTQTVTFAAGDYATLTDTQNVTVTTIDDAANEGNETINLALDNLNTALDGQAVLGNSSNVTTITDNDAAGARVFQAAAAGDFTIQRNGANLEILQGAALVASEAIDAFSLTFLSHAGGNTLTVLFSGGNPIPSGGLTLTGAGVGDTLIIEQGTFAGSFDTVTYTFVNNSDGSVALDPDGPGGTAASVITYTGLAPVIDNTNAANRSFVFTGGTEVVDLTDTGGADGMMTIDSTLGESVNFTNPTASLSISVASTDDLVRLNSVDAAFAAALNLVGAATDIFRFTASNVLPIATDVDVTLAALDLNGLNQGIDALSGTGTVTSGVAGAVTLTVGLNGGSGSFTGVIQDGAGTVNLTKSGGGTLTLANGNTYTGKTIINGGTVSIGAESGLGGNPAAFAADHLTLNGGTLESTATFSIDDANRGITLSAGGGTFDVNTGTALTIANVITGAGNLTKADAGELVPSVANTYTGRTIINAGTLTISAENRLGANPGAFTANQLTLNGGTLQTTASFSIDDSNRGVTLGASGGTFDVNAATTLTVANVITGTGILTKADTGTLSLSAINTYTGRTTINAGTVVIGADSGLGANPAGFTANQLTLDGGTLNTTASLSLGGNRGVTLNAGGGTFDVDAGTTLTIPAAITGGGALTKVDTGTLTLTGDSTYSGDTNANAGTVNINGSVTSNVIVAGAATMGGTGTITGNVSGAGNFGAVGEMGTQQINGNFVPTGTVNFRVNSPYTTAGTDYRQYVVSGTVNLSGATLAFSNAIAGAAPALPNFLTLISKTSAGATLASATPAQGTTIAIGGATFRIFYNGGDGNDVVLFNGDTPNTVFVDDNFTGNDGTVVTDADPVTGGNQAAVKGINAFATIQAGVDAVAAAGSVIVNPHASSYPESVAIAKSLTLNGNGGAAGTTATAVVIDPAAGNGLTITANNVTVQDIRVTGAPSDGINVSGVSGLSISNVRLDGNTGEGLDASGLSGTNTLTGSTVSGNGRGILLASGPLTVTNSTISGNVSAGAGGGVNVTGGALTLTNVTISGNSGVGVGGIDVSGGAATLTNVTVTNNTGGGARKTAGLLHAINTIFSGNGGANLSGALDTNTTNLIDGTALLAPLGDYGGPTQTHSLLPGSPALDAGTNGGLPGTDQRGLSRIVNTTVDIGAVESRGFTVTLVSPSNAATLRTLINRTFRDASGNNALDFSYQVQSADPSFLEPVAGGILRFTPTPGGAGDSTAAIADVAIPGGTANNAVVTATRQVTANGTPSTAGTSYQLTGSAGGNNRVNWQLFNQVVAALQHSAQPNNARSGADITFGPGQSTSFQLTMIDQGGAEVVVSGENVSIETLNGPAGGQFNVGTLTVATVGSKATYSNLQIFRSSYTESYRINGRFTNPNASLIQNASNPFFVFPRKFEIDVTNSGFGQIISSLQGISSAKGFLVRLANSARGKIRIIIPIQTAIAQGLTNQITVNVLDADGPAVAYDGPVDLKLLNTGASWTADPIAPVGAKRADGDNTVVQAMVTKGDGKVVVKGVSLNSKTGSVTIRALYDASIIVSGVANKTASIPNVLTSDITNAVLPSSRLRKR